MPAETVFFLRLAVPVPPRPTLEAALGWNPERKTRWLACWWEPAGDEVILSDGYRQETGNWHGYLAYVDCFGGTLRAYDLGDSDNQARQALVFDLEAGCAYIISRVYVRAMLRQLQSPQRLADALAEYLPVIHTPSCEEVGAQIRRDREALTALTVWLKTNHPKPITEVLCINPSL